MIKNLVSIIMACYNEKIEWIEKSIESLINQSYCDIEIIIVNDNPDNIEISKVLSHYESIDSRIKIINNEKNLGLVKSLNRAIDISKGAYIARMDSDDISDSNRIKIQTTFLENNPEVDLVMSYARIINEEGDVIGKFDFTPCKMKDIKALLKYKNISIHPTWMFRRKILERVKYYSEVPYAEDYEFLCRTIMNNYTVEAIPKCLIDYRIRGTSICNSNRFQQQINFQKINKLYRRYLKKNIKYKFDDIGISMSDYDHKCIILNDKFVEGKKMIKSKKIIKGSFNIIKTLLNNNYKKKQLFNEIGYFFYIIKLKI